MRLALASLLLLSGCVPDFVDDTTRVTTPRILAVQATPAEAKEGETVTLDALVAAPVADTPALPEWSLCIDRKSLSDLGPVSARCVASLHPGSDVALDLPSAPPVVATLPETACQLFGPERPDPKPGQPSGRPVDPDVTGGFYQPVLAWLSDQPVLGGVRLSCPLTGASVAVTRDFNARYHPNRNPAPSALEKVDADGGSELLSDAADHVVHPGERVSLRVTWPECAPDADGCGGTESYVVYDPLTQALVPRTESFVVSWYATDGSFAEPRTEQGPASAEEPPATGNTWTAPGRAGPALLWAVVRDDRGGQAWIAGSVTLSP